MAQADKIDLTSLHRMVQREIEDESILEIDPNFYRSLSDFIGDIKGQEFDGVEDQIKTSMAETAAELAEILVRTRLEKAKNPASKKARLLDEEKFITDSEDDEDERASMVLSAIVNGKSRSLESAVNKHKTRMVVVRFLADIDQMTGADLQTYGPFHAEDIGTIPYENALSLFAAGTAVKVRWKD